MNRSFICRPLVIFTLIALPVCLFSGCGTADSKDKDFHTSGSQEADQRAEQRIDQSQQLRGPKADEDQKGQQQTLYARLGGAAAIDAILDDFLSRVIQDPRVNWSRQGVTSGGMLGIGEQDVSWKSDPASLGRLKRHMAQFIALATGGPAEYQGKPMKDSHKGMNISNVEFDAAVGDLKASLDACQIPTQEQKELLAIIETTRPQIVEKR